MSSSNSFNNGKYISTQLMPYQFISPVPFQTISTIYQSITSLFRSRESETGNTVQLEHGGKMVESENESPLPSTPQAETVLKKMPRCPCPVLILPAAVAGFSEIFPFP
jgi:hypothetical protein